MILLVEKHLDTLRLHFLSHLEDEIQKMVWTGNYDIHGKFFFFWKWDHSICTLTELENSPQTHTFLL